MVQDFGAIGDGVTDDTAAIQAGIDALTPGGTLTFEAGKTYLVSSVTLKANCRYTGSATIKQQAGANAQGVIVLAQRVTVDGLTLDGDRGNNTGTFGTGVIRGASANEVVLRGLTVQNAPYGGIFLQSCQYATVEDCTLMGCNHEAVFLYRGCSYSTVRNNAISNCLDDGIKVHGNDLSAPATTLYGVTVSGNTIDYRGVTLTELVIGIEIFRKVRDGAAQGFTVSSNVVYGPDGVGTDEIFGISFSDVDEAIASDNTVYGPGVEIGFEDAGGDHVIFDSCTIDGFSLFGYSVSGSASNQIGANDVLIDNATTRGATATTNVYGVQFYGGGANGAVRNSSFEDAGERAIMYNNAGDGGIVDGCSFATVSQAAAMMSIYVFNTDDIAITNNTGASGAGAVQAPVNNGGSGIVESGNVWT